MREPARTEGVLEEHGDAVDAHQREAEQEDPDRVHEPALLLDLRRHRGHEYGSEGLQVEASVSIWTWVGTSGILKLLCPLRFDEEFEGFEVARSPGRTSASGKVQKSAASRVFTRFRIGIGTGLVIITRTLSQCRSALAPHFSMIG